MCWFYEALATFCGKIGHSKDLWRLRDHTTQWELRKQELRRNKTRTDSTKRTPPVLFASVLFASSCFSCSRLSVFRCCLLSPLFLFAFVFYLYCRCVHVACYSFSFFLGVSLLMSQEGVTSVDGPSLLESFRLYLAILRRTWSLCLRWRLKCLLKESTLDVANGVAVGRLHFFPATRLSLTCTCKPWSWG